MITAYQVLEKVDATKAKLLLQMNCSIEAVSCHTYDKCGYLMDEGTANIVDNLPDLEKIVPEDVHMLLVYRRIILSSINIWSIFARN